MYTQKELIHEYVRIYSAACYFYNEYLHMDVEASPRDSSFEVPLVPSEDPVHSHLVLVVPKINNYKCYSVQHKYCQIVVWKLGAKYAYMCIICFPFLYYAKYTLKEIMC